MRINPHLSFNGDCREALEFYAACLGGSISFLITYGDSPLAAQYPAEYQSRILHATLTVSGREISADDAPPGAYRTPQGFSLIVGLDNPDEAARIFDAFATDGAVQMPLAETFWARRFGVVTDRFGIAWQINCERPR